jgi:methylated-DNA-[protein]-cysteine S-methyltransferase
MTPDATYHDEQLAAWLGDAPRAERTEAGPLAEALDALYAQGPGETMTARAVARAQAALHDAGPGPVYYDVLPDTPIGPVFVAVSEHGLLRIRFGTSERAFSADLRRQIGAAPVRSPARVRAAARQVRDYLLGKRRHFDVPLDLSAVSDFQRQVLLAACQIPRGQVATYAEVARRIGRPRAARAVGQALRGNPVPIVVPCHRVLAADGSLRGYLGRAGIATKAQLLALEGVRI